MQTKREEHRVQSSPALANWQRKRVNPFSLTGGSRVIYLRIYCRLYLFLALSLSARDHSLLSLSVRRPVSESKLMALICLKPLGGAINRCEAGLIAPSLSVWSGWSGAGRSPPSLVWPHLVTGAMCCAMPIGRVLAAGASIQRPAPSVSAARWATA